MQPTVKEVLLSVGTVLFLVVLSTALGTVVILVGNLLIYLGKVLLTMLFY